MDVALSAIRVVLDIHPQWSVELHPIVRDLHFVWTARCSTADFSANRVLVNASADQSLKSEWQGGKGSPVLGDIHGSYFMRGK